MGGSKKLETLFDFKSSSGGSFSLGTHFLFVHLSSSPVQDLGEALHSESHSLVQVALDDLDVVVEVGSKELDVRDSVPLNVVGAQVSWKQDKRDVGLVSGGRSHMLDLQRNLFV